MDRLFFGVSPIIRFYSLCPDIRFSMSLYDKTTVLYLPLLVCLEQQQQLLDVHPHRKIHQSFKTLPLSYIIPLVELMSERSLLASIQKNGPDCTPKSLYNIGPPADHPQSPRMVARSLSLSSMLPSRHEATFTQYL